VKSLNDWLKEYGESHQHPTNVVIHKVCVPLIMFSLLGLLWCIPQPLLMKSYHYLNFSVILIVPCLIFYFFLNLKMFIGMGIASFLMLSGNHVLDYIGQLLPSSIIIFICAWIVQIWGHRIEGKRPSFLKDLTFLLIGPLWVLRSLYKRLGIRV